MIVITIDLLYKRDDPNLLYRYERIPHNIPGRERYGTMQTSKANGYERKYRLLFSILALTYQLPSLSLESYRRA